MKKYIILVCFFSLLTSCSSDFLDRNPLDQPSNETFWNTEKDALAAASGCYADWNSVTNVIYFDCASDNAYGQFSGEGWQVLGNGFANPLDYGTSFMSYANITKYNNFLENISRPEMDETLRTRLTAEVRFLRAWDYFMKVTLYGDVPLVKTVLKREESNLPRTPKAEVVQFILDELTEIAPMLDVSYSGDNVGRITRGAALTLKARMEIFEGDYAGCLKTCEEIRKLEYSLFPDYRGLFRIANESNSEVILDIQYVENLYPNDMLGVMVPSSKGGWSSINPTQSLVEEYDCIDGLPTSESTLYDPKEPYKNRDPRLSVTVLCPGQLYSGSYFNPIDVADPNGDYYVPRNRSKTGYNPRKYIDDLSDYGNMWDNGMNIMVMRYAEVLLMYAECKMETNSIDNSLYEVLDAIRVRAGMPKVDRTKYASQTDLRKLIRHERRVELAMEGLRWFDICRWKIGEEVMPGDVKGAYLGTVDPKTGALTLNGEQIFVETRQFDPAKNYLWPIPQSVIDATPAIKQNPNY